MDQTQIAFDNFKDKLIGSYVEWKKYTGVEGKPFTTARTCIESLCKALVIRKFKKYKIIDFEKGSYNKLLAEDYFDRPLKGFFSISKCLYLLRNDLPFDIYQSADLIKDIGDVDAHSPDFQDKLKMVDFKLYQVLNWFFNEIKEPQWESVYITPKLETLVEKIVDKTASKISLNAKENFKESEIKLKEHLNSFYEKIHANEKQKEINLKKTKNEKVHKIKKILIISSLSISLILAFLFVTNSNNQTIISPTIELNKQSPYFNRYDGKYHVLLYPFDPIDSCEYQHTGIEAEIVKRLKKINEEDSLNLDVIYDSLVYTHGYTFKEIEKLVNDSGADLIIWGDLYEHCFKENEACIRYINFSENKDSIPNLSKTGESKTETFHSTSEIKEGKLQRDIDYIIYWIAAMNAYKADNYLRGLQYLKYIEKLNYSSYELFNEICVCYSGLQKFDSAMIYCKKALKLNPDESMLVGNYASLYEEEKDYGTAKKWYIKAISMDSTNVSNHINYANLLYRNFKDSLGAKALFEKILKFNMSDPDLHWRFAEFLAQTHDTLHAINEYLTGIKLKPTVGYAHNDYAELLLFSGDLDEASRHFQIAIQLEPNNAYFHWDYSLLLNRTGHNYDALKEIEISIEKDSTNALKYLTKASFQMSLKQCFASYKSIRHAFKIDSTLRNSLDTNLLIALDKDSFVFHPISFWR